MKYWVRTACFAVISFFLLAPGVHAALSDLSIVTQVTPTQLTPYQTITVTLVSYSTDLDGASISWTKDGKLAMSGTGEKSYSFTLGGAGSTNAVTVSVRSGGFTASETLTFIPQDLDVIWEASDAYTPPFYKGKALPLQEASYTLVAFPYSGNRVQSTGYIFSWEHNGNPLNQSSGYSKNMLTFVNNFLKKSDGVKLSVRNQEGTYQAEKTFTFTGEKAPTLLFYKKDPLLGVLYNKAYSSEFTLAAGEETIVAEPYYFSRTGNNLEFTWKLNGNTVTTGDKETEITLKNEGGETGKGEVGLTINNISTYFQKITKTLTINL